MGYTTNFQGKLCLSKELTKEQFDFLKKFNNTRRMKRDVNKLMDLYNGKDGFPERTRTPKEIYGIDGEYFVGGLGYAGQEYDKSVMDLNNSPKNQPGLWCGWEVTEENGFFLQWDGGEKFYNYIEWLQYLIDNFFLPWGIQLNGEIYWIGEDFDDKGKIVVENNEMVVMENDMENELINCCLCDEIIQGYGNNSLPIMEGRCCDNCNSTRVIPERIILALNNAKELVKKRRTQKSK